MTVAITDPIRKSFPSLIESGLIIPYVGVLVLYLTAAVGGRRTKRVSGYGALTASLVIFFVWVGLSVWFDWRSLTFMFVAINSYVFFAFLTWAVPRLLGETDSRVEAKLKRWLLWFGIAIGLSAIGSLASLGRIFEPINEANGLHSFGYGEIDLFSGIFATGERLARLSLLTFLIALADIFLGTRMKGLSVAALLISSAAMLTSGRRFALLLAVLSLLALVAFGGKRVKLVPRVMALGGMSVVAVAIASTGTYFSDFIYHGVHEVQFRTETAFRLSHTSLYGQGAGTYSQGVPYKVSSLLPEGNIDRIVVEMGWGGLTVGLILAVAVCFVAFNGIRMGIRHRSSLRMAAGIYPILLIIWSIKTHVTFGEPFSLLPYWMCIGYSLTPFMPLVSKPDRANFPQS